MTSQITIALDAMGGDRAPDMVVRGADIALERMPELRLVLVGDEGQLKPLIGRTRYLSGAATEIIHTDQEISATDRPSIALRTGRKSSMQLAIDLVGEGRAAGIVSAGNTGALMAMSKLTLRMCPGINRPAIASFFPTMNAEACMLDLGANIVCDAENLVQFAIMGEIFARTVLGLQTPSVGLLNVGSEEQKGHDELREAADVLRNANAEIPMDFRGFVEGDDITSGAVDVIVTDGFTGNVALKTAEGMSRMMGHYLRNSFKSSLLARIGSMLSRSAVGQFQERLDPRRYNGAMFLGLNGIAVKSHGGTDELGFANAVGVAADMARYGFLDKVKEELTMVHSARQEDVDQQVMAL